MTLEKPAFDRGFFQLEKRQPKAELEWNLYPRDPRQTGRLFRVKGYDCPKVMKTYAV